MIDSTYVYYTYVYYNEKEKYLLRHEARVTAIIRQRDQAETLVRNNRKPSSIHAVAAAVAGIPPSQTPREGPAGEEGERRKEGRK